MKGLIIPLEKQTGICCFCGTILNDYGNSTWPIYYKQDGELNRCCDECDQKYVIAARKDRTLIMQFREQFGIDYTEYRDPITHQV